MKELVTPLFLLEYIILSIDTTQSFGSLVFLMVFPEWEADLFFTVFSKPKF